MVKERSLKFGACSALLSGVLSQSTRIIYLLHNLVQFFHPWHIKWEMTVHETQMKDNRRNPFDVLLVQFDLSEPW